MWRMVFRRLLLPGFVAFGRPKPGMGTQTNGEDGLELQIMQCARTTGDMVQISKFDLLGDFEVSVKKPYSPSGRFVILPRRLEGGFLAEG